MNAKKNLLSPLLFFAGLFFIIVPAHALETAFGGYGFYMDIPEGFYLAEQRGEDRYRFRHTLFPAEFQIAVYPAATFSKAGEALSHITSQIGSLESQTEFTWRNRKAALATLAFPAGSGWAAAAELPLDRGWVTLAAYSYGGGQGNAADANTTGRDMELLHLSVLDSLSTDAPSVLAAGLVTTFCFPPQGAYPVETLVGGSAFTVPMDKSDAEANQYVVDREFALLVKYAGTEYIEDAWKRYYRMIYRDSWQRLEKAGFILKNRLPRDRQEFTESLVQWLFTFSYERDFEGSDFINLPEAFAERKGDCDTRSLLLALLLKLAGVDSALLISPEFSHSVAAVAVEREGPSCMINGEPYALVDATSSKTDGRLVREMADISKWFAVTFQPEIPAAHTPPAP